MLLLCFSTKLLISVAGAECCLTQVQTLWTLFLFISSPFTVNHIHFTSQLFILPNQLLCFRMFKVLSLPWFHVMWKVNGNQWLSVTVRKHLEKSVKTIWNTFENSQQKCKVYTISSVFTDVLPTRMHICTIF